MSESSDKIAQRPTPNAQRPTPNAQRPTPNADSCPNPDDIIQVVLAVYDPSGTYSQHAGVVMTSIFENTHSKVTVHILHDDTLTQDNRQKFIRTAEKYSQGLELHDVTDYRDKLNKGAVSSVTRTLGTLYRLFIPALLAMDKVIYLDCDILVNMDIKELWNIDTDGNILAGVPGFLHGFPDVVRKKLNEIDYRCYINAGVLVMDLSQIRKLGDLFKLSMDWFSRHSHLGAWGENDTADELIDILNKIAVNTRLTKKLLVRRAISHTVWKFMFWQPVRLTIFLCKEAYYRLTHR